MDTRCWATCGLLNVPFSESEPSEPYPGMARILNVIMRCGGILAHLNPFVKLSGLTFCDFFCAQIRNVTERVIVPGCLFPPSRWIGVGAEVFQYVVCAAGPADLDLADHVGWAEAEVDMVNAVYVSTDLPRLPGSTETKESGRIA